MKGLLVQGLQNGGSSCDKAGCEYLTFRNRQVVFQKARYALHYLPSKLFRPLLNCQFTAATFFTLWESRNMKGPSPIHPLEVESYPGKRRRVKVNSPHVKGISRMYSMLHQQDNPATVFVHSLFDNTRRTCIELPTRRFCLFYSQIYIKEA